MSKSGDIVAFRLAALNLVNLKRAQHGAPLLKSSKKLDSSAQLWAEALAGKTSLGNSTEALRGDYGESISSRTSQMDRVDIGADEVIEQWYAEKAKFDFKVGGVNSKGSNFTQMVWLDSLKVGFGKAQSKGKVVVVAHYSPPGNYRNQYASRVKPSIIDASEDGQATPTEQLTGELAGFRVTVREVLRDEEVSAGRPIVIERERTEYEDAKGNTKEKIVERRREKPEAAGAGAGPGPGTGAAAAAAEAPQTEYRQGSVLLIKEKELSKFSKELLSQANKHRSKHGIKSLKLNSELCTQAQVFAEELSRKSKLHNSGATYKGERLGESIASRWSSGPTDYAGDEVADHWYNEMEKYRFNEEPNDVKGFGNFTQMIWKNSKELGVGKAVHRGTDGSHQVVIVCYFHPAGNVLRCFRENVLPPTK